MNRILVWPQHLPDSLAGLYDDIAGQLAPAELVVLDRLEDVAANRGKGRDIVVLVVDAALASEQATPAQAIAGFEALAGESNVDVVAVVGDGYVGTDVTELTPSMTAAAAISVIRSIAVRHGTTCRANVVSVPQAMFGADSSQRGPLAQPSEVSDVTNAVAFLAGPTGGYVSGQTVYVDGGRHLFSSMTA